MSSGFNLNINLKRLGNIFRSLRYRNYRLYFAGQSVSLIGTWIQRIALPWLVYRLTDSPFMLGVVAFASQIPTLFIAPFAGVLVDRWNRYYMLITTQVLLMIQAVILTVIFFTEVIKIWHIVLLGTFVGFVNAFDMPTRQSLVVDLVEDRDDLGNAIALNSSMVNSARLIGPSIAGVIIAVTNEGVCFLLNAVSYFFVIVSLLFMRIPIRIRKSTKSQPFKEFKEGFKYVFGFPPIRAIILMLALMSFMGMSYTVLMPVFAKEVLHGGSHTYGFLMGASGVGALIGALYLASRKNITGLWKIVPMSAAIFGCGLVIFSLTRTLYFSIMLMFAAGLGMIMQMASSNTIIQTMIDDDKRGRVMSFYIIAFIGTAPFGSLLAGGLAKIIGAPYTIMIGGIACILGATVFTRKLSGLKKLVRPIYVKLGIIPEVASGIQSATELTLPPEK
jgi:MFS family permease